MPIAPATDNDSTSENAGPFPITLTLNLPLDLLRDIVTTAVEGGIDYWAHCKKYQWYRVLQPGEIRHENDVAPEGRISLPFPVATIVPDEDPGEFAETTITPEHIRLGIERVLSGGVNATIKGYVLQAVCENDASYIDADAADSIVQLGVLGSIVYG